MTERQRAAYRYRDEHLQVLHTTSVPITDEAALEYVGRVDQWFPKSPVKYVEFRDHLSGKFVMMKIAIENGTVTLIKKEEG